MDLLLQFLHDKWMERRKNNRRDWEVKRKWYLAALMAALTSPATPAALGTADQSLKESSPTKRYSNTVGVVRDKNSNVEK